MPLSAGADGPREKPRRGWIFYLFVSLALGTLGLLIGAILLIHHFWGYLGPVGDMAGEALRGRSAPGAAEARALGCDEAMVIDAARFKQGMESIIGEHARRKGEAEPAPLPPMDQLFVICQVRFGTAPTCDAIAQTYAAAVPSERPFGVLVQYAGKEQCSTSYAGDGTPIGALADPMSEGP